VSATTSVDHEWSHDESTNRSAEKHRKNQGKLGVPKRGVFEGVGGGGQKRGNGLEQGDGRDVKKFLGTSVAWWSGTDSILRKQIFERALGDGILEEILGACFLSGFGVAARSVCGERNDANHFWWERWRGKLGKQIWIGGQKTELEERRGGVGGRV
jgi:hypothetical protein